jgi:hypothetical protein
MAKKKNTKYKYLKREKNKGRILYRDERHSTRKEYKREKLVLFSLALFSVLSLIGKVGCIVNKSTVLLDLFRRAALLLLIEILPFGVVG